MFILFSLKHFFNIFDSLDSEKKKTDIFQEKIIF